MYSLYVTFVRNDGVIRTVQLTATIQQIAKEVAYAERVHHFIVQTGRVTDEDGSPVIVWENGKCRRWV